MQDETVEVLMATCNGEAFLAEQMASILSQTHRNVTLRVRDDGSHDGTAAIAAQFAERHPGRVIIEPGGDRPAGAARNFSALLEKAAGPYVMLADQDDVWLKDKVAVTLARMKQAEQARSGDLPILVHTDLRVVDEALSTLAESFWRYQNLRPHRTLTLNRLLVQNTVTGCTAMLNRALVDRVRPMPEGVIMHDWWLALVAAALGAIEVVDQPTVMYRQHGANDIGAKKWSFRYALRRASELYGRAQGQALRRTQQQAELFLHRYREDMDEPTRQMVATYADLRRRSFLSRRMAIVRGGFFKVGLLRNLGLLLRV